MSRYRRATTAGASYFFTVVVYRRQTIFCDDVFLNALHAAITSVRVAHPFAIDAWVLLPSHLHCEWTLPEGEANFSTRWKIIKRAVSVACRENYRRADWMTASKIKHRESTIWQRRYWEHQIRDDLDLQRHVDYIHFNPVKHGYVKSAADWPHSTFHRYLRQGVYSPDWAGGDDVDELKAGEME
jgi:putative transposase